MLTRSQTTTGLVPQIGSHSVKSRSALQSLTALSVGDAEFHAVVKSAQDRLSPKSMYQDLGSQRRLKYNVFDGEFFDGSIGSKTAYEAH